MKKLKNLINIIQISTAAEQDEHGNWITTTALCSDSSVWQRTTHDTEWTCLNEGSKKIVR